MSDGVAKMLGHSWEILKHFTFLIYLFCRDIVYSVSLKDKYVYFFKLNIYLNLYEALSYVNSSCSALLVSP